MHKRKSEQLRIEKELFPNCIQAPIKYENKRKSSMKTNENSCSTVFPGEKFTSLVNMANTANYVQQWLRNNEKNLARKPFSDLNINTSWGNKAKTNNRKQNLSENFFSDDSRKRTCSRTADEFCSNKRNKRSVYKCDTKKVKRNTGSYISNNKTSMVQKHDNDESGIFMENEPVVIDDSQETVIDKDKNAWLSVLKACQTKNLESTSLIDLSPVSSTNDSNKELINFIATDVKLIRVTKVPFFKRSAIIETCKYCLNEMNLDNSVPLQKIKPVKITVDANSFLTTISIFNNVQSNLKTNSKNTVSIQTDISELAEINKDNCKTRYDKFMTNNLSFDKTVDTCDADVLSQDLFTDDKKVFGQTKKLSTYLVIQESDSDTDLEISEPLSVKADVHRSCEESEFGILNAVDNVKKHESKHRRRPRGHTPTSTDSSEKENYHPNRKKRGLERKKLQKNKSKDQYCWP